MPLNETILPSISGLSFSLPPLSRSSIYTSTRSRPGNGTSSHTGRVKTEHDEPPDDSHRQPRSHPPPRHDADSRSMPPSAPSPQSQPSPKKRRMTISGSSQPVDHTSSSPTATDAKAASPPIVIGMPSIARDDPNAVEQVRSMLSVKRNQEALIEKRRGSLGGPLPSSSQPTASSIAVKPPPGSVRTSARSPNMGVARTTRAVEGPNSAAPSGPSQQSDQSSHPPPHPNSLPAPPISFAGRRAFKSPSSQKKKPADIVISPRDPRIQPVIQSAPPQQGGRFPPMALPSLPNVQQPPGGRRIPGNVPPTPTRLTLRSSLAASSSTSTLTVPTPASVPISTILVPQTPAVLSRVDSASHRSAFLAPFEALYDALRDVRESKAWMAEQLAKVQALQSGFDAAVDVAVERRMGGLREEVMRLQRRIDELEHARGTEPSHVSWRRRSVANGELDMLAANVDNAPLRETYTFPPVQPRVEEGANGDDSDVHESDSPAPAFDVRRQSTSAVRMDPPPPQQQQQQQQPQQTDTQGPSAVKSPPSSGIAARRQSYQPLQPTPPHVTSRPGSPMEAG